MLLLLLSFMVVGLLALGITEPQIAANLLRGTQALALAEAGAERAIAQFVADPSPVNTACDPSCPSPVTPVSLFANQALGQSGTYTVTYQPVAFATVRVDSTGQTSVGSVQRVVRIFVTTQSSSEFAALADEVEIEGNGKVKGTLGAVHGNTETELEGNAFVDQTATSAGTECDGCTDPSHVGVTGTSGANKPAETLPNASPLDFLSKADFVLGDGTTVVNGITVPRNKILVVATGTLVNEDSGSFAGWKMSGAGEWELSGNAAPSNGTYYASEEIKVTGNIGTAATPFKATFISGSTEEEGKVEIEGNTYVAPFLQDLLVVAGKVKLKGNASLTGAIMGTATHHGEPEGEVEIEGNATLTGNILSNGEVKIKGNATLTYNVATRTPLLGSVRVLSWNAVSP
jgi:hypothetical protein